MSKIRLTITIEPEIVKELDKLIDGRSVRNRSHAIESLVHQQLMSHTYQAIILAGGSPAAITRATTKIAGIPVINHLINLLKSSGVQHIYILTDQNPNPLQQAVNHASDVDIITQAKNLGTAGALVDIAPRLSPSPVIVIHGDIFTDINLIDFTRFHRQYDQEITIAVKPKLNQQEFGKAIMNGHRITQFLVKPETNEVGMINMGVYVINPSLLLSFPKTKPLMLESDIFPKLAQTRQLAGFLFEGIWYDIAAKK